MIRPQIQQSQAREFDLADASEAHGEIMCDGIDASEPNDCDHVYLSECRDLGCIYCGRMAG